MSYSNEIEITHETVEIIFTTYNDTSILNCSKSYGNKLDFWISGIALNTIGFIGIIGNILSMIILSQSQMHSSITYLLIGLARCDTIFIITSMLMYGFTEIHRYTKYFFNYFYFGYPQIAPYIYPLANIAQTASIYLTLMISLERYVAVCHPLHVKSLCTYGRAKISVLSCLIFSIAFNMVRFWEYRTISCKHINQSELLAYTSIPVLRNNVEYQEIYINWCTLIVNYLIPFIGLLVTNILIFRKVHKANKERQKYSSNASAAEKFDFSLANMLFGIVIVFFCCNIFELYLNVIEVFYLQDGDFSEFDIFKYKLANLLVTLNSSVNFVIYVMLGKKFRGTLCSLFLCKK